MPEEISKSTFTIGIAFAILASSLLSTIIAMTIINQEQHDLQREIDSQGKQETQGADDFTVENFSGLLPAPAYDSGWVSAEFGTWMVFGHNLNTTEVMVYVIRNEVDHGISQYKYGEVLDWLHLSNDEVMVRIGYYPPEGLHGEVRVMIWKISRS